MAKKYMVILMGLCLGFSSCSFPRIYLDIFNQTSTPVWVSYTSPIYLLDTIKHEIKPGFENTLNFPVPNPKSKRAIEKLSRRITFFCFEAPTKSVRFEGPEEVMKIFNHKKELGEEYKFIITDSLFNCK